MITMGEHYLFDIESAIFSAQELVRHSVICYLTLLDEDWLQNTSQRELQSGSHM